MSQPEQPRWIWSQERQQYFYYEANSDTLVFQDGTRVPRPPHIPRTAFTSASSQAAGTASSLSYASNPNPRDANYVTRPAEQQYQPQPPRPAAHHPPIAGPSRSQYAYQDASRGSSSKVDALAQNLAAVTVSTQRPLPTQSQHPQPVTPQVTVGNEGQRFVDATDPRTNVRTRIQTAPANAITDPALLQSGIVARSRLLPSDNQVFERLFKSFRLRDQPRKFFTVGKVFHVLWVEPAGESNTMVTGLEVGTTIGAYGERAFSKVRRFVVVREGDNYCSALPITSYGHRGVGKPGVNKSEHSMIHTTKVPPEPLQSERPGRGEEGMRPHAIKVDADDPAEKLDALSRLDYGKVHTIQHNIKVKAFGKVHPKSMFALINQFGNVWHTLPIPGHASTSRDVAEGERESTTAQRRPSQAGGAPSAALLQAPSMAQTQLSIAERQPSGAAGQPSSVDRAAALQANVRAAVQGLVQQGHSEKDAERAIQNELARRQQAQDAARQQAKEAIRRRPAQDEQSSSDDDDNDDDDDDDNDNDNEDRRAQRPSQMTTTQPRSATGKQSYSSAGGQPSSSRTAAGAQSTTTRTTHTQARSTGASISSQAQSQANRAQAEALMARLLQEGKTREEALAIIRQRFGSGRS